GWGGFAPARHGSVQSGVRPGRPGRAGHHDHAPRGGLTNADNRDEATERLWRRRHRASDVRRRDDPGVESVRQPERTLRWDAGGPGSRRALSCVREAPDQARSRLRRRRRPTASDQVEGGLAMTIDLDVIRGRLSAGETLPQIAVALGTSWQRLSKALRGKSRFEASTPKPPSTPDNQAPAPTQIASCEGPTSGPDKIRASLVDRYRPQTLAEICGQGPAMALLQAFAKAPYPAAFVFAGETGTGKTSAALALARDLGCVPDECEFGGIYTISAGDQTA